MQLSSSIVLVASFMIASAALPPPISWPSLPDIGHVSSNACSWDPTTDPATKPLFNTTGVQNQIQSWMSATNWTDAITAYPWSFRGPNFPYAFATIAETPTASMYVLQTTTDRMWGYNLTAWAIPPLLMSVNTYCAQGGPTNPKANNLYAPICVAPLVSIGMAYLKDGPGVFVLCGTLSAS